jgi:hypothetical protein
MLLLRFGIAAKPIINQRNKDMKIKNKRIHSLTLAFLLLAGLGLSGCSTGTKDGDVNVEEGGYKDKDPTEHNVETKDQPSTDTTNMTEPYERTEAATDKDVDGKADQPGTTSEHNDPQKD